MTPGRGSLIIRHMGRLSGSVAAAVVLLSIGGCGGDESDSLESAAAASECPSVEFSGSEGAFTRMPPEPEELTAAVAESFCSSFTYPGKNGEPTTVAAVLPSEDASCISTELIERFGEPAVREFGFIGYPWSLLVFALKNQSVEREQAEQLADSFVSCSDAWKLLLIKSVTQGADQISEVSAGCVGQRLSDDDAREVLVLELDRAYDDPSQPDAMPYPETVEPLLTAMEACLSPTELDALDWH